MLGSQTATNPSASRSLNAAFRLRCRSTFPCDIGLLREPHGFEGLTPTDEGVNPGRLPVSLLNQVGYLSLDHDAASAPLSFGEKQHEVTLVAKIDHRLDLLKAHQ